VDHAGLDGGAADWLGEFQIADCRLQIADFGLGFGISD
jgi:hypothetical protein